MASDPMRRLFVPSRANIGWQELSVGQAYWRQMDRMPEGLDDNDARTMVLSDNVAGVQWGQVVERINASGLPTGELMWRIGGDGDAVDNSVIRVFPNLVTGSSIPARINNGTDSTSANLWRNRIHCASGPLGGTTYQGQIIFSKAKYDADGGIEWQPAAGHHYDARCYHPAHGWIEAFVAPNTGTITPETNQYPYTGQTDPLLWGTESYGLNVGSAQLSKALIGWDPDTGLWSRLTDIPNALDGTGFVGGGPMDYNASSGKVWFCMTPSSSDRTHIWEWDGTIGGGITRKTISVDLGGGITALAAYPPGKTACWWLEGEKFLFHAWLGPILAYVFDNSANTVAKIDGSAILNASWGDNNTVGIAVDRQNRRVYWLVPPVGNTIVGNRTVFRLYVSTFDALGTLTEVPVVGADALDKYWVEADLMQSGSKFFYVYGGYLHVIANGTIGIPGWSMPSRVRVFRLPI